MENSGPEIRGVRSGIQGEEGARKENFRKKTTTLLNRFTLSLPALKLFRFTFGFILLFDLVQHFIDVRFFYTSEGILPLTVALEKGMPWHHSIYFWNDHPAVVTALYLIHIGLAFLFMAGRGLPWVTGALWVFQFSLRNRNFNITDAGDDLSIILLFICMFLPLKQSESEVPLSSFRGKWRASWSFIFLFQLLCIYFFSAFRKTDPSWSVNFTASSIALHLDQIAWPLGHALIRFPALLQFFTAFYYYLEWCGPVLFLLFLFLPQKISATGRKTLSLLFIFFHLSLVVTMRIWAFPLYCIAAWAFIYFSIDHTDRSEKYDEEVSPVFSLKNALLIFPIFILIVILTWNVCQVRPNLRMPEIVRAVGRELSLWQNWGMFAPYPMTLNQHIRFKGIREDGSEKEIFSEKFLLENRHRVKFALNLTPTDPVYLDAFSDYFCRKDPELVKTRFDAHLSTIHPVSLEATESDTTLWKYECHRSK